MGSQMTPAGGKFPRPVLSRHGPIDTRGNSILNFLPDIIRLQSAAIRNLASRYKVKPFSWEGGRGGFRLPLCGAEPTLLKVMFGDAGDRKGPEAKRKENSRWRHILSIAAWRAYSTQGGWRIFEPVSG